MTSHLAISIRKHQTKGDLLAYLSSIAGETLLLDAGHENTHRYYSAGVTSAAHPCRQIGICCHDFGIEPSWLLTTADRLFIGFGDRVAVVRTIDFKLLVDVSLQFPFRQFLLVEGSPLIHVIHDIGAIGFDLDGGLVWRVDEYLVENHSVAGAELHLDFVDAPSIRVDLMTGKRV